MSVLVYIHNEHSIGKNAFELVSYAKKIGTVTVLTHGNIDEQSIAELGEYGASNILVDKSLSSPDDKQLVRFIVSACEKVGANTIVFSHDHISKNVAPRLSVALKAGLVQGAVSRPDSEGLIQVNVFSGKAFGKVRVNTDKKIISLLANSVPPEKIGGVAKVEDFSAELGDSKIKVISTRQPEGDVSLPDAELVVSAGRAFKKPEDWQIIEDLANALGAATACSRPIADEGLRPHHEHVGQTGLAIRPNLYIAAGISGAIQHLAGVSGSKVIVVINSDPEAPFFKAADYGIVGDVFEILPKITQAVQKLKG